MERTTIASHGFHGIYHPAKNPIYDKKAVIVLGGSEGNENIPISIGRKFSECGITALGICYWNVPGLPNQLIHVPVDPFEKAIAWLKQRGHQQIAIYGISKGAELALLCASLIPDIGRVISLSPSHCVWAGMSGSKSMFTKKFTAASEFTWRKHELPYMTGYLKYGPAILNFITQQQMNLAFMYEKPLKQFNDNTAIKVENIQGDVLFIYAENDLMWPSRLSVQYMIKRFKKNNWKYHVKEISYEKASHIMVPLTPPTLKMFKVERKFPEECHQNREDAFTKALKWLRDW